MTCTLSDDLATILENDSSLYDLRTHAAGPAGKLPLTEELLLHSPSGDVFGLSESVCGPCRGGHAVAQARS